MKKLVALLLAALLMFASVSALAEVPEINWSDVEDLIAENNLEGDFVMLEEQGLMFWVSDTFIPYELSDEEFAEGYLVYFFSEDGTSHFGVQAQPNLDGLTLDQYIDIIAPLVEKCVLAKINGMDAVVYSWTDANGNTPNVVSFLTETGYIVEFPYIGDDDFARCIISSIQPIA